jgi:hypothetical protein
MKNLKPRFDVLQQWTLQHTATFLLTCVLIILIAFAFPVISKIYLHVHEFGHGISALILAQAGGDTGEKLTLWWVYGEHGPTQTNITWQRMGRVYRAITSVSGGIMEMLFAFVVYTVLRSVKVRAGKSARDTAVTLYLAGAIIFAIFYSTIFADTDGLALGPVMQNLLGTTWSIISKAIAYPALFVSMTSFLIALAIDIADLIDRNKWISQLNNALHQWLISIGKKNLNKGPQSS